MFLSVSNIKLSCVLRTTSSFRRIDKADETKEDNKVEREKNLGGGIGSTQNDPYLAVLEEK